MCHLIHIKFDLAGAYSILHMEVELTMKKCFIRSPAFAAATRLLGPWLVAAAFAAVASAPVYSAELPAQKSNERGVTVAVTPVDLAAAALNWRFKLVLDTHSQDLGDDLMQSAVLVDESEGRHRPVAWDGAPPGGHHREGVLTFKPISPPPDSIELRISRPGEPEPRVFRWTLK